MLTGCAIGAVYRYEIYQDRIIFERYKKARILAADENKAIEELRVNPLAGDIIPHSGGLENCASPSKAGGSVAERGLYTFTL